ncbi:MAG: spore germination protein [Bacillota bacterium]|nr:spore germination protein [Bacillota bacterium]
MNKTKYGRISANLSENTESVKKLTSGSADLVIREITVNGIRCAAVAAEGMVDSFYYSSIITYNLFPGDFTGIDSPENLFNQIYNNKIISPDEKLFNTLDELFAFIYSGFGVILVDGVASGIAFGAQGFSYRSVSTPSTDENIKGSKEGFTEAIKINQTLVRRRVKSPELVFESLTEGNISKTDCALVYISSCVSERFLRKIRKKLTETDLDMVLESGSIKMMLTSKPLSLFSEIGSTERPDTLAKKLYEGKVGIMIDGTPFVLIVPFLFAEHFHSLDDFAYKAVYSNFIRFLKFSAFAVSFLLPGLYVAAATFHPGVFADSFRSKIMEAGQATPYSYLLEALLIHFSYEIMREAGLRLPKEIGHAVSIVGGLIIGDAAVSAGIVSAPMVIVAALAAISAFVVPALMDSLVVLRFLLIFLGGFWGMYGIALGIILVCVNICAKTVFGVPYSSSISPSSMRTFTSFLYKSPKQQFASPKVPKIYEMPGFSGEEIDDPEKAERNECPENVSGRIMRFVLSVSAFAASAFSIWIFTLFTERIVLPGFNIILLPIPMLLLTVMCKSCTRSGCDRVMMLFAFLTAAGAAVVSFNFIVSGLDYRALAASLSGEKYLTVFLLADILVLLLFAPFCRKKDIKSFAGVLAVNILSLLIFAELAAAPMTGLLPFSVLFYASSEFLKLTYTVNIIDGCFGLSSMYGNSAKPVLCVILFAAGWMFLFI